MLKREEFTTFINNLRAVSPRITDAQRKGLLRLAVQRYRLTADEAAHILETSGLVVGEEVNYFEVLGVSIETLQHQTDAAIEASVAAAHQRLYRVSLNAGGAPRPDGRTQEQWRELLNHARDTLKDPQKRQEHIETVSTQEPEVPPIQKPIFRSEDVPEAMVLIPAGEFLMGSDDGTLNEKPVHAVYTDAFYMDRYPVTNAEYKMFIDANPEWQKRGGSNYHVEKANHPAVYVSWYAAMAYAKWVGKRLPTEAGWEKAARGGLVGQKYPWGNPISSVNANYDNYIVGRTPVGRYPPNDYGLYDMAGNVWEWCLDAYDADFYSVSPSRNPLSDVGTIADLNAILDQFTDIKSARVLRGGSWYDAAQLVRVANRHWGTPANSSVNRGFRCVRAVVG